MPTTAPAPAAVTEETLVDAGIRAVCELDAAHTERVARQQAAQREAQRRMLSDLQRGQL